MRRAIRAMLAALKHSARADVAVEPRRPASTRATNAEKPLYRAASLKVETAGIEPASAVA
jgi:hypothetical protein